MRFFETNILEWSLFTHIVEIMGHISPEKLRHGYLLG